MSPWVTTSVEPPARQQVPDLVHQTPWVRPVAGHAGIRQQAGERLVAPDARDLFGDIRLDGQVAAMSRDDRHECLRCVVAQSERAARGHGHRIGGPRGFRGDLHPGEQCHLFGGLDGQTQQSRDASGPEGHPGQRPFDGVGVDDPGRGTTAGPGQDQLRRPIGADARETVFLALLEAQAGFAPQGVPEGGPADAHRVEQGRFHDDPRGRLRDLAGQAAHDARDAQRARGIRDEQHLRIERPLDVVERRQRLATGRSPDDDPAVRDGRRVEGVDGLAQLEHHVVAGIDDVADGPHTRRQQAPPDGEGRRADGHAIEVAGHEPGAQGRVPDIDRQVVGRARRPIRRP